MFILFYSFTFLSLLICSITKHNLYISSLAIITSIVLLFIISIYQDGGGDIEKYERIFYGVKLGTIQFEQFIGDAIKVLIKVIFNESELSSMPLNRYDNYLFDRNEYNKINHYGFYFYQLISNLVFIAGSFSLAKLSFPYRKDIAFILVLLIPVTMTLISTAIENALALGIIFYGISLIKKNTTYFVFLTIISGFIHWSSFMFLPLILYKSKLLRELSILFLIFIIILTIFNINLIIELFRFIPDFPFSEKITTGFKEIDRGISPYHIYLSSIFAICGLIFHMTYKNSLNIEVRDASLILLSALILLLIISFLFIQIDSFIVRIGSIMKIIATIYFCSALQVIEIKKANLIIILLGLFFSLSGIYSFN